MIERARGFSKEEVKNLLILLSIFVGAVAMLAYKIGEAEGSSTSMEHQESGNASSDVSPFADPYPWDILTF